MSIIIPVFIKSKMRDFQGDRIIGNKTEVDRLMTRVRAHGSAFDKLSAFHLLAEQYTDEFFTMKNLLWAAARLWKSNDGSLFFALQDYMIQWAKRNGVNASDESLRAASEEICLIMTEIFKREYG